ncbi:hypothetical protein AgCh_032344 [Apium graveolens]
MCTSVLLVGESKEEVNAPQFMDFATADLLDYAISSSQSHFRSYLNRTNQYLTDQYLYWKSELKGYQYLCYQEIDIRT